MSSFHVCDPCHNIFGVSQFIQCDFRLDITKIGKTQEDLLKGALSGVTIEWSDLTSETMKYSFVKEVCCQIEPYMRDEIEVTPDKFKYMCHMLGVTPHNTSNTLISCAVEQADPITMFHIQVELKDNGNMVIQRVRFIV